MLDKLKEIFYDEKNVEFDTECCICLEPFTVSENLFQSDVCKHSYHQFCITTWLLNNSNCPKCRCTLVDLPAPLPLPQIFTDIFNDDAMFSDLNLNQTDFTQSDDNDDHDVDNVDNDDNDDDDDYTDDDDFPDYYNLSCNDDDDDDMNNFSQSFTFTLPINQNFNFHQHDYGLSDAIVYF